MKKPYRHDVLSGLRCPCCDALLKANLLAKKKGDTIICFSCYQWAKASTQNPIVTAREVRTGKKTGRAKGIYT